MTFIPYIPYIPYLVYAVNSLGYVKDAVVFFCECIYEGYAKKRWVFTQRNAYPSIVSSTWRTDALIPSYDPATFTVGEGTGDKIMVDVVTAELNTPSITYDLSSFFYSVKWYLTTPSPAPSLYELVLLYLLHEKICVSTNTIDSYTLTVLTSDADEHVIEMNSPLAKQSFRGFTEGVKATTEGLSKATTEGLSKATTEGLKVD